MSMKALFLAWQDKNESRQWFPVGRLDADVEGSMFRFRYTGGAERARQEVGFPPALDFPDMERDYRSSVLFPLFRNRIMAPGRPDLSDYLQTLDLADEADPVEILSVDGGYRVTDAFEVFPKIEKGVDGSFRCRFFLHGWRHVNPAAQDRINHLEENEELYVTLELTNSETNLAVQIQTLDYHMIGRAPRYLVNDLTTAMAENSGEYAAHVVRVNPLPAPSEQRLLIELNGNWGSHEPMADRDFEPLVA